VGREAERGSCCIVYGMRGVVKLANPEEDRKALLPPSVGILPVPTESRPSITRDRLPPPIFKD
jgi:hypothetical protein